MLPPLREREAALRRTGVDVRFVHGALGNVTAARAPRTVYTYGRHPQAHSVSAFEFDEVHVAPGGVVKPRARSSHSEDGPRFSLAGLLERILARNASAIVAARLDVEGSEYELLDALTTQPRLLCSLSYLFVEFHLTATPEQRARLPHYGLPSDVFERLKDKVHAAMEQPGCKLQIYWRSFWASCGDQQRFEWRDSAQASSE
jgi:hypothetical protein